jgi:hypothetical protein
LQVYVGGTTASNIDNAAATTEKLPIYLALIAVLGFLLLVIAFRSILVPLIDALANLLTLAVALGAVTAIFQFGWGSQLLGVGTAAPIESLVPVLVIGVMFGLSMDYQVFLVSRMHEEWSHTRENARSVRVGLVETGQVIVTAAIIMLCVFASFGADVPDRKAQLGLPPGSGADHPAGVDRGRRPRDPGRGPDRRQDRGRDHGRGRDQGRGRGRGRPAFTGPGRVRNLVRGAGTSWSPPFLKHSAP